MTSHPKLRSVVLDTTDALGLAEFYHQLLGWDYRDGRPPEAGEWVMLVQPGGGMRLAFQQVDEVAPPTWPDPKVPQQLHLDFLVESLDELAVQHRRATELGARLLDDRSQDEVEPLYLYADPAGHPFCIFVVDYEATSRDS